jgi:acetoin utilization deacetylase AcuC-like enzyme
VDAALRGAREACVPLHFLEAFQTHPSTLELVHEKEHINRVQEACKEGLFYFDADTAVCTHTYQAALLSVSCAVTAAELVLKGEFQKAFALTRPPGHHAKRRRAAGFCYFNNMAVMVEYIRKEHGIEKVFIVDFDAHAGDGTMHIFYKDPNVFFFSVHQDPSFFYPGEGFLWQIGEGEGRGSTINFPLSAESGDADYQYVMGFLEEVIKGFLPQIICVSCGFDAHKRDHISALQLSDEGFYTISHTLTQIAESVCDGRLIFVLEGGYNLLALKEGVKCVLEGFIKKRKIPSFGPPSSYTKETAERIKEVVKE